MRVGKVMMAVNYDQSHAQLLKSWQFMQDVWTKKQLIERAGADVSKKGTSDDSEKT